MKHNCPVVSFIVLCAARSAGTPPQEAVVLFRCCDTSSFCSRVVPSQNAFVVPSKNASSVVLHRFIWKHNVAKKAAFLQLFLQLRECTLSMGAKSCKKSSATFSPERKAAIWPKSLQLFSSREGARKAARWKLYRFGSS